MPGLARRQRPSGYSAGNFIDVKIHGGEEMARLGRAMRALSKENAGAAKTLRSELRKGVKEAAKPVVKAGKDAARDELPHRGGLNEYVARSRFSITATTSARSARVRLKVGRKKEDGGGEVDLRALNRGKIRHPIFGTDSWVAQAIKPEVISGAFSRKAADIQGDLLRVIDDIIQRIKKA